MRVRIEQTVSGEWNRPPEELLGKLEVAFRSLARGLLSGNLSKAGARQDGEVDVLEDIREELSASFRRRLRSIRDELLSGYREG